MRNAIIGFILGIIISAVAIGGFYIKSTYDYFNNSKITVNIDTLNTKLLNRTHCFGKLVPIDSSAMSQNVEIENVKLLFSKFESFPSLKFSSFRHCPSKNIYLASFVLDSGIMGEAVIIFNKNGNLNCIEFYNIFDVGIDKIFRPSFVVKKHNYQAQHIYYSSFHDTILVYAK